MKLEADCNARTFKSYNHIISEVSPNRWRVVGPDGYLTTVEGQISLETMDLFEVLLIVDVQERLINIDQLQESRDRALRRIEAAEKHDDENAYRIAVDDYSQLRDELIHMGLNDEECGDAIE